LVVIILPHVKFIFAQHFLLTLIDALVPHHRLLSEAARACAARTEATTNPAAAQPGMAHTPFTSTASATAEVGLTLPPQNVLLSELF
jgi:hypothetical protein